MSLFKDIPIKSFCGYSNFQRNRIVSVNSICLLYTSTAYMLYLIYIAEGEHKTAHYAIGTGFMALGMMIPGMPAGWIQEHIGSVSYTHLDVYKRQRTYRHGNRYGNHYFRFQPAE